MSATLTTPSPAVAEDEQRLILTGIGWKQYVTISGALGDRRSPRLIYLRGRLTFLTKSHRHEWLNRSLGDFVVAIARACRVPIAYGGETTFRREDMDAGVEGDDTFYLGENAERMRGPQDIDLTIHPPPDLAIEIEVTHPANDVMPVYGQLGVPEVWRYDANRKVASFWLRREDGTYAASDRSAAFPLLTPNDLVEQMRVAEQLGVLGWLDQLDAWVRDVLLPRRGGGA